jgi:Copper transport outer membrane protein, MctB
MISFRFHIVSLTAVMLALGIGLVLGTTFLDDATVNTLENQLSDLERSLDAAGDRNARQESQIDSYEQETSALDEQIGERLFTNQLADVPVLLVTTRGVDGDRVDEVTRAFGQANANLIGTWWLTDKLALDDDNQVSDLGDALQLSTDDTDRLRSNLARQLGDVLFAASDPGRGDVQGLARAPAQTPEGETAVLSRLREGGFIEYQMPEGADGDVIVLPASGLRVVFVGGPAAELSPEQIVVPILIELASDGPVPAVAVEPSIEPSSDGEDPPPSLVVDIREDDDLSNRVSTVDDLDRVSGVIATVLAVVDADPDPGPPVVGHYGLGDGTRLLPPPPEASEGG